LVVLYDQFMMYGQRNIKLRYFILRQCKNFLRDKCRNIYSRPKLDCAIKPNAKERYRTAMSLFHSAQQEHSAKINVIFFEDAVITHNSMDCSSTSP